MGQKYKKKILLRFNDKICYFFKFNVYIDSERTCLQTRGLCQCIAAAMLVFSIDKLESFP